MICNFQIIKILVTFLRNQTFRSLQLKCEHTHHECDWTTFADGCTCFHNSYNRFPLWCKCCSGTYFVDCFGVQHFYFGFCSLSPIVQRCFCGSIFLLIFNWSPFYRIPIICATKWWPAVSPIYNCIQSHILVQINFTFLKGKIYEKFSYVFCNLINLPGFL